ncbi:MAG: hypothetical protein H6Q19_2235 [Bacteroidetes bacterium]|nr:hypothetical protein [Bacteroidota bacterium]
MKTMKKIVFLMLFISCTGFSLKADPAKKVNLKYNNGVLNIQAIHPVKNVTTHYIDQFVIKVNGVAVKTVTLDKQSSKEDAVLDLTVPEIKTGSVVEVTTRCNQFGKKSAKLNVK